MSRHQQKIVHYGEYGPIRVGEDGNATFGNLIRCTRKQRSFSPEEVGILYGRIAGTEPVSGRHVLRMEQNDTFFPHDPQRRWVLAKLLDIPPLLLALVGLGEYEKYPLEQNRSPHRQKPLDLGEYHTHLQTYWLQGYPQPVVETVREISKRLHLLHDRVLYAPETDKHEILRLLCGYHLLMAKIAEDYQAHESALQSFHKALLLAQENNCKDLYAPILFRRACMQLRHESFFAPQHGYARVQDDLSRLQQSGPIHSPQLKGKVLAITAKVQIQQVTTYTDFSATLHLIDQAETLIGQSAPDQFAYLAALDNERYCLDRAEILMLSPLKALREPQHAQEYLDQAIQQGNPNLQQLHTERQIDNNLFQARIYLDQGYYPFAATTVENAVLAMQQLHSRKRLNDASYLLQELKAGYPHMPEIASLEVEILRLSHPQLFA